MDDMELSAKLEGLKKEIPYKFRVQSSNAYGFTCVAYIDARDVMDLLDEAVGSHCWQTKYDEHKGNLYCSSLRRVSRIEGRAVCGWVFFHSLLRPPLKSKNLPNLLPV